MHEFAEARRLAAETGVVLDWAHLDFNGEDAGVWRPVEDDPADQAGAALEDWQEAAVERMFASQ